MRDVSNIPETYYKMFQTALRHITRCFKQSPRLNAWCFKHTRDLLCDCSNIAKTYCAMFQTLPRLTAQCFKHPRDLLRDFSNIAKTYCAMFQTLRRLIVWCFEHPWDLLCDVSNISKTYCAMFQTLPHLLCDVSNIAKTYCAMFQTSLRLIVRCFKHCQDLLIYVDVSNIPETYCATFQTLPRLIVQCFKHPRNLLSNVSNTSKTYIVYCTMFQTLGCFRHCTVENKKIQTAELYLNKENIDMKSSTALAAWNYFSSL